AQDGWEEVAQACLDWIGSLQAERTTTTHVLEGQLPSTTSTKGGVRTRGPSSLVIRVERREEPCRTAERPQPSSWPPSEWRSRGCPAPQRRTAATPCTYACATAAMTSSRSTPTPTPSRATPHTRT